MAENKELLDWYYEDCGMGMTSIEQQGVTIEKPTTSDLNPVPADSPQVDIQQELINKATTPELTQKNDAVIAADKMNTYKAYGILRVIDEKLKMYNSLAGAGSDDPMRKEGIANDLKTLSRELANIIGAL